MMNGKGKQLTIWGTFLQLGTVVGLVGTIFGMLCAFARGGQSGMAEPEALATDIGIAMYATAGGMIVSLVGIVLILIALLAIRYRAPWFKIMLWVLSILWLLSFPLGTVLGIVIIVYLVKHKNEFTEPLNSLE